MDHTRNGLERKRRRAAAAVALCCAVGGGVQAQQDGATVSARAWLAVMAGLPADAALPHERLSAAGLKAEAVPGGWVVRRGGGTPSMTLVAALRPADCPAHSTVDDRGGLQACGLRRGLAFAAAALAAVESQSGPALLLRTSAEAPPTPGGPAVFEGGFRDGPLAVVQTGCKTRVPVTLSVGGAAVPPGQPQQHSAVWRLSRAAQRVEEHRFPVRARGDLAGLLGVLGGTAHPAAATFRTWAAGQPAPAGDELDADPRWAAVLRTTCQVEAVSPRTRGGAEARLGCFASPAEQAQEVGWQLVDVVQDPVVVVERVVEHPPPATSLSDGARRRLERALEAVPVAALLPCSPGQGAAFAAGTAMGVPVFGPGAADRMDVGEFAAGVRRLRALVEPGR
ncbi:MAG: hypothetical protein HY904_22405 [Deltaproteobacteria bacterium]|nr:hypothetical protein [Deltaproteobacteria bacterium]